MYAVQMDKKTLTQFLNEEMKRRDMSARKFAEYTGINHAVINKFSNDVPSEENGYPSIHTLRKLSVATGVSLLTLISLSFPDLDNLESDLDARLLAEQIAQLPPDMRTVAEGFIRDALSQPDKK